MSLADGPLCAPCWVAVHGGREPSMGDGLTWSPGTCPRCGIDRTLFDIPERTTDMPENTPLAWLDGSGREHPVADVADVPASATIVPATAPAVPMTLDATDTPTAPTMTVREVIAALSAVADLDKPLTIGHDGWWLNVDGVDDNPENLSVILEARDDFDTRQF